MNRVLWFAVLFVLVANLLLTIWKRMQAQRRRAHALDVLKTHGLTPVLYIPTVGVDDADLRKALDEFAFSGQVILTSDGTVVGGFAGSAAIGPLPHLMPVVPNTGKV
ncbi:conserved protein of unknown function [Acidithiobacillus ferrivorans]|uniref:Uncharacterized protein n=1 Tax=Acidithiobacillus ferrivorans TaxID=160808 RepID=A0A060UUZ5_9PROT|nr:hypothetical protein [Acidithiobacillus ferrivorans]CDQ10578.1 conserved hypothetical protein [Acidithiobacillus ferrivorans]SMH64609.1 conserved protein of unknown function [Acidithiobacillus ferrivorans]